MSCRGTVLCSPLSRHRVKARFVLVGAWNTLFGYGLFCLLDTMLAAVFPGVRAYMAALVVSNVLAIVNAYVLHKYVTFRSPVRGLGVVPELFRFSLTYAFSFCTSMVLMPLFVEGIRVPPKAAAGMIIAVTTAVSWLGHSRFSFGPGRGKRSGG